MISSNTIKDFRRHKSMYPTGTRGEYYRHRLDFVEHNSGYEDTCYWEHGPIQPKYEAYLPPGVPHPINKGDQSGNSGKYSRSINISTISNIRPIASKIIILRKSEDVALRYIITRVRWMY